MISLDDECVASDELTCRVVKFLLTSRSVTKSNLATGEALEDIRLTRLEFPTDWPFRCPFLLMLRSVLP